MNRRQRNEFGLHTALFHPPVNETADACQRDLRLDMATCITDIVGIYDDGGVIAFPAGFLRAPTMESCQVLAQTMLALSARTRTSLVFGIDEAPEDLWDPLASPPTSHVFACEAGRPVLWPAHVAPPGACEEGPAEARCILLRGMRIGVVITSEVFNVALRERLLRSPPDLTVLLTHRGPNKRWQDALTRLKAMAPTVVVGDSMTSHVPTWTEAPPGWIRTDLGGTPSMTLQRYRPVKAVAVRPSSGGHGSPAARVS